MLAGLGGIAASAAFSRAGAEPSPGLPGQSAPSVTLPVGFPRKADFAIEDGYTYINAAYTHPIPKVALAAAQRSVAAARS